MGLKTQSSASELRAIRSICDGSAEIRSRFLAILQTGHFATATGKPAFERIIGLLANNKTIPKTGVLKHDPTISADTQEAIAASEDQCADVDDAEALIDQLELFRKLRVIYDGASDMLGDMKEPSAETAEKALGSMETIITQARSSYEDVELIHSGAGSNAAPVVDKVLSSDKPDRVLTGFKKFDEASGGFARKDLVLIAANTGGGKSVMAEQLGINAYLGGKRNVAIVSYEMDEEEYYARLLSNITKIPFADIYLHRLSTKLGGKLGGSAPGGDVKRCRDAWEGFDRHGEIEKCKFTIWCPTVDVTPNQIGAILRPGNYDLVLIDYVGLVTAEKEGQLWENLGEITKQFKGVARRNDCVVAIMAQLDEETNKVKYSKAMRHHSSYVWWWNYDEDSEESGQVKVIQDKARHCERFPFNLMADFSTMSFSDGKEEEKFEDVSSKSQARTTERPEEERGGELPPETVHSMLEEAREKAKNAAPPPTKVEPEPEPEPKPEPVKIVETEPVVVKSPAETKQEESRARLDMLSRRLSQLSMDFDQDDL